MNNGWIGFDLDGTLAVYDGWRGPDHIGKPIEPMMVMLRKYLAEGYICKIFTARATVPEQVPPIKAWLKEHSLPDLEVTNVKDFKMVLLFDDRCRQVITNTGEVVLHGAG